MEVDLVPKQFIPFSETGVMRFSALNGIVYRGKQGK